MILIPVVVAIWSYAVYKYLFWSEETNVPTTQTTSHKPQATNQGTDSAFTLIANYRDPFLDKPSFPRKTPSTPSPTPQPKPGATPSPAPKPSITVPVIDWSIARYNGLVQRAGTTNERDGLLSITNHVYHVSPGDIVKGIEVLALYPDSIRLRFEDETKTITKR